MTADRSTEEVDDVEKTLMRSTPATALSFAARVRPAATSVSPNASAHGTGLPFAGYIAAAATAAVPAAQVAVLGARTTDLPGPVPRGAPV